MKSLFRDISLLIPLVLLILGTAVESQPSLAASTTLPFELIDNRIFVKVFLNGKGPFKFIVDTGGSYIVDSALTSELGLVPTSWFQIGGAGQKTVPAYNAKLSSFRMADITASDIDILGVATKPIKDAMGFQAFDGCIGDETLHDNVMAVDFENRILTFTPANEFTYTGSGEVLPITFLEHPSVDVQADGVPARVWIDTGDRSTVTLFEPFVSDSGLLKEFKPNFETITGYGVGGPIPAKVAKLKSIRLGTLRASEISVRLPTKDVYSSSKVVGSLGTGLLRAFNLVVDYSHARIILDKNSLTPQPYDRSGMWVSRDNGDLLVMDVVPKSPAQEAGLSIGDKIVEMDSVAAEKIDLPVLRSRLSDPTAKTVLVKYSRDGTFRTIAIALRDLLR